MSGFDAYRTPQDRAADKARGRAQRDTEALVDAENLLSGALRSANEIVDLGQDANSALLTQRETLLQARDKNRQISSNLDRGDSIVRRMSCREKSQTIIMWIVFCVIMAIVGFIVWYSWFRNPTPDPPVDPKAVAETVGEAAATMVRRVRQDVPEGTLKNLGVRRGGLRDRVNRA
ncbi:hypothetical protein KIPB_006534 [Kipferlia bialata]|uniref:t-SNARE coiled-coil homology domain-containing protein n=1 Tax=Kipferlia bialata TaxID=797122 RepID=A0A9K3CXD9_9EUKA|nr:hypothetical protein KIPB_006534 [Kipferlia bialata]|eukprot:g6534.t1